MDVSARDLPRNTQPDAAEQTSYDQPFMRAARELTAHELDEQRRLVRASLLMTGS
jgi:hypothetical protein